MADVLLHDFVLPRMALEDLRFGAAWKQAWRAMRAEKETFFSYFILRVGLPLMAGFVVAVAAWFPVKLAIALVGMSGEGFALMLDEATGAGAVLRVCLAVFFGVAEAALGLLAAFALGGPLAAWVRSYAVEFCGSRYRVLGEALKAAESAASGDSPR